MLSDLAKVTQPVVESGQELGLLTPSLMFCTTTGARQQEKAIQFISVKCSGTSIRLLKDTIPLCSAQ